MSEDFKVTFWGVRGSYPVPEKDKLFFGGNTTCLEVSMGKTTVIVDAGTGIINLGKKITENYFKEGRKKPLELTILFSHLHHDHTQGLPFFAPLFLGQSILHIFGPMGFSDELKVVLERSMTPPNFPIDLYNTNSVKNVTEIRENNIVQLDSNNKTPIIINKYHDKRETKDTTILIKILNGYCHPKNGIFVYKFEYGDKSVVYATDVEGYLFGDSKLIDFAKNADLLIHDAQYSREDYTSLPTPKQGFGHSIPEMGIEVARKANVKMLAFTHHDPDSTDSYLKRNQTKYGRRFKNSFFAREGFTYLV